MLGAVRWHYCAIDEVACMLGSDGYVQSKHVVEPLKLSDVDIQPDAVSADASETDRD